MTIKLSGRGWISRVF